MWRFVTDQNYNNVLVHRLRRQYPNLDLVRVQDVGLSSAPDPDVLEWAALEERILLTHDLATMPDYAYARIMQGLPMTGVFAMHEKAAQDRVFEDLSVTIEGSDPAEYRDRILYLPF